MKTITLNIATGKLIEKTPARPPKRADRLKTPRSGKRVPPVVLDRAPALNHTSRNHHEQLLLPADGSRSPWLNPTQLERPTFLMNFPFSYSTGCPNNPWMRDLTDGKRQPD